MFTLNTVLSYVQMDENSKSKWGGGEIKKEIGGLPQFWSQAE
jgi:hypothetical protein